MCSDVCENKSLEYLYHICYSAQGTLMLPPGDGESWAVADFDYTALVVIIYINSVNPGWFSNSVNPRWFCTLIW